MTTGRFLIRLLSTLAVAAVCLALAPRVGPWLAVVGAVLAIGTLVARDWWSLRGDWRRVPRWSGYTAMTAMTTLADWFAERTTRGILTRAACSWVLVGIPVVVARVWWSAAAAIAIFVVAVTIYVVTALRYVDRHNPRA